MKNKKRLTARVEKCSPKRIRFDSKNLKEIKEAITKADIRKLLKKNILKKLPARGTSRVRARKRAAQKRKGRQKGIGKTKGKKTAKTPPKRLWVNKIRAQREHLRNLKKDNALTPAQYKDLYRKTKGGFFRSRRHLKLYIQERLGK